MTQAQAARENGAKSHGPITAEGKAASALNATKHGLSSNTVVLSTENPAEYTALLNDYVHRLAPQGAAELDLVHEIASNRWRMRRVVRLESAVLDAQCERQCDPDLSPEASAKLDAAANAQLQNLNRYESRIRRSYERAMIELKLMQLARKADETPSVAPILQNEPKLQFSSRDIVLTGGRPNVESHPGDPSAGPWSLGRPTLQRAL